MKERIEMERLVNEIAPAIYYHQQKVFDKQDLLDLLDELIEDGDVESETEVGQNEAFVDSIVSEYRRRFDGSEEINDIRRILATNLILERLDARKSERLVVRKKEE